MSDSGGFVSSSSAPVGRGISSPHKAEIPPIGLSRFPGPALNVLNKLPKTLHAQVKSALHEIWQANSQAHAEQAFDRFIATYEAKYPKAVTCLAKDRQALLACYDFPAAHWQHLRTTNPIESTFATLRLRTVKTRNCLSARSGLSLHPLAMSAQQRWRKLRGFRQLADVIAEVKFIDGIDERTISRKAA